MLLCLINLKTEITDSIFDGLQIYWELGTLHMNCIIHVVTLTIASKLLYFCTCTLQLKFKNFSFEFYLIASNCNSVVIEAHK